MGASGGGISWTAYPILQIIGILLLVISGVGLLVLFVFIKKRKGELMQTVEEIKQRETLVFVDKFANFFGQESKKYKQVRGNGLFIITENSVLFYMLLPKKEIKIQLSNIKVLEYPASFLGKSIFKPLLKINFVDENGQNDSAAWVVKDLESVKKILEDNINKI